MFWFLFLYKDMNVFYVYMYNTIVGIAYFIAIYFRLIE